MPNDETDDESSEGGSAPESPSVTPIIEVTDLVLEVRARRRFTGSWLLRRTELVKALDGVSFTIAPGEAVGYVGALDAAKTTMVDLLTGEITSTSGTVRTCGLSPDAEQVQLARRIGLVSGNHSQLWQDLPLDDSLRILANAHHVPEERWLARRAELVDRLELASFIALPTNTLSRIRRIRGELAAALIHEPELLILDEPTIGLDVVGKEQVRSFLAQENRVHGRTLVFAASDLGDVEQICQRVLVVDRGRLVHDGDVPSLLSRAGIERTLVVDLTEAGGLRQRLTFIPGTVPVSRVLADVAARTGIRHLTLEEPDLETLISRL